MYPYGVDGSDLIDYLRVHETYRRVPQSEQLMIFAPQLKFKYFATGLFYDPLICPYMLHPRPSSNISPIP